MPQYTNTYSAAYAPVQDGYFSPSAFWGGDDLWHDSEATLLARTNYPVGMTFQLLSQFDSARGLPLDPPGFTAMSLAMVNITDVDFSLSTVLKLYVVNNPLPALWSTSNPPTATGAVLLDSKDRTGVLGSFTFNLNMTLLRPIITHSTWRGRLALVLELEPNQGFLADYSELESNQSATAALRPTLATTEFSFTTGIVTHDITRPGRIRTCARTGTLAFADEFVEDGYVKGLWVHESAYDPEDHTDEQVVPASEGTVNDEVP